MAELVRVPARRAGDPGSNPGPGEKLLTTDSSPLKHKMAVKCRAKEIGLSQEGI